MTAIAVILAAVLAFAALLRTRFVIVTVSGASMAPTLVPGDRLLVRRTRPAALSPGRIVVLRRPPEVTGDGPQWMVKRLAAVVPPDRIAVVGDNAAHSHDSRQLGPLPADLLLGVVMLRLSAPNSGRPAGAVGAPAPAAAWTATSTTPLEEE